MSHPFFAYIARMRYIVRWGLMRNTMQENIQEHSHMVAVLAHALAVIRRDKFGGTVDPGRVAAVALYHDAPEIFTGDLPTPVKYANPAIQTAYKAVEADAAQRLVAMLPQEMRPAFAALLEAETGLHVVLWDERRTTIDAHHILYNAGKNAKKRKKVVDAVAASLILEGYLIRRCQS